MSLVTKVGGVYIVLPMGSAFNPNTDFTYTGSYSIIDDGEGHWRVKFLTSGTLTVTGSAAIQVFLVGGGGGGRTGGGGGGYTLTQSLTLTPGTYNIVIGTGGPQATNGGNTTAFSLTANGGVAGGFGNSATGVGGKGGSGGGGTYNGTGGTNGGNGTNGSVAVGGTGQGTTTKEFAETDGTLYSTGGNSYGSGGAARAANTGDGGHGNGANSGWAGGSGILIIRDHR